MQKKIGGIFNMSCNGRRMLQSKEQENRKDEVLNASLNVQNTLVKYAMRQIPIIYWSNSKE